LSSERNTERVREDASDDNEDGEDDDELSCVIGDEAHKVQWEVPGECIYLQLCITS